MSNVAILPVWNDRVTAAERLRELATMAELEPEKFQQLFVAWVGEKDGKDHHNDRSLNFKTTELLGWFEIWKHAIIHRTNKGLDE